MPGDSLKSQTALPSPEGARSGWLARRVWALALAIPLCVIITQAFLVGSYRVSSPSMVPCIWGPALQCECPAAAESFLLPVAEIPHPLRVLTCPWCGTHVPARDAQLIRGQRVIVNRTAYLFHPPRRWDLIVFQHLDAHGQLQTLVKRVVGLPGERVQIVDGEIVINGQVARKSLAQLRGLAIPVVDFAHLAKANLYRSADADSGAANNTAARKITPWDNARLWDPARGCFVLDHERLTYGNDEPLTDRDPSDQLFTRPELEIEPVRDLLLSGKFAWRTSTSADHSPVLQINLANATDDFELTVDLKSGDCRVLENGRVLQDGISVITRPDLANALSRSLAGEHVRFELAIADGTVQAALDDTVFCNVPREFARKERPGSFPGVMNIEIHGGVLELTDLRLARDVYYTRPFGRTAAPGVGVETLLGPGEYFVLGDNSPVSEDSRFWAQPAVLRSQVLGQAIPWR